MQWRADNAGRKSPPTSYEGSGKIATGGLFDIVCEWDVKCTYDDGLVLHMLDNRSYKKYRDAPQPEMPFGRPGVTNLHNGAVFIGTEGWAIAAYEKLVTHPPSLADSVISPKEIHLPDSSLPAIPEGMNKGHQQAATAAHHQNWIKAIRGGTKPVGDIEGAVSSDLVSLLSELCIRTGQSLRWDPVKQTIMDNDIARMMIRRPMRSPWGVK